MLRLCLNAHSQHLTFDVAVVSFSLFPGERRESRGNANDVGNFRRLCDGLVNVNNFQPSATLHLTGTNAQGGTCTTTWSFLFGFDTSPSARLGAAPQPVAPSFVAVRPKVYAPTPNTHKLSVSDSPKVISVGAAIIAFASLSTCTAHTPARRALNLDEPPTLRFVQHSQDPQSRESDNLPSISSFR
ncbi:uncharacterized protein EI90DRAFT_1267218 [Cantharellus anzutake]|uniref:uncharacterized protein n=1 Tax=Cantharellus anzutake TaxID=1750568 RepID=UPI001906F047|nr:uncharacterized protein EI90DRAFT_1267218 [Cantharellus anzutake]KAF8330086.1 hypothetical protein EI90DRAFT_1267218 [Cantharellus anzutake]